MSLWEEPEAEREYLRSRIGAVGGAAVLFALGMNCGDGLPRGQFMHRDVTHLPLQPKPPSKRRKRRLRGKAKERGQ